MYPVAVVIVSWHSATLIERCLQQALAAQPAEIVVVDNNSRDATVARCRRFAAVRCLPLATNTGFAHGCNVGIACTQARYVLFLNDDAALERHYLRHLCALLERQPQAASATGKLLLPGTPVRLDSAGMRLDRWALRPSDRGHGELDRGQYNRCERIFGPSGAAALYRRSALQGQLPPGAVPPVSTHPAAAEAAFDPTFFAYYEDVDLAWRLSRRGWQHWYEPAAQAWHQRRGPQHKPAPIRAQAFLNRYRTWYKNEPFARFLPYAPLALAWEAARLTRLTWQHPKFLSDLLKQALQLGVAL